MSAAFVSHTLQGMIAGAAALLIAQAFTTQIDRNVTARIPETITTRVFQVDGRPAAGASVLVMAQDPKVGRIVARRASTGADGSLKIEHIRQGKAVPIFLIVRAKGEALYYSSLLNPTPAEIHLKAPASARIRLLLPDGAPATGLKVLPKILMGRSRKGFDFLSFPNELAPEYTATTDKDGRCVLTDLPSGNDLDFDVDDDRFDRIGYTSRLSLKEGENIAPPTKLSLAGTIAGRVTREGLPVANVGVGAQSQRGEGWGSAVTDAKGNFVIKRLGAGAYNVALKLESSSELESEWTGRAQEVVLQQGETKTGVTLHLEKGALIVGKVSDATGKPAPDVPIGVYGPAHPQSGGWVQGTTTKADGTYRHRVPAGQQFVYVMLQGGEHQTKTVADGQTVTIDFKLPEPAKTLTLSGRVLDAKGTPAANATINVYSLGVESRPDNRAQESADEQGRFTITTSPGSTGALIRAISGTQATRVATSVTQSGEITLKLEPGVLACAAGKVFDEAGKPIEGAKVSAYWWMHGTGRSCGETDTDGQGSFRFENLYPGEEYSFQVDGPGYGRAWFKRQTPSAGESVQLDSVKLLRADRSIVGSVVDSSGKAISGARIEALDQEDNAAYTDAAGKFKLTGIAKGSHPLFITKGTSYLNRQVDTSQTDPVLVLKPFDTEPAPVPAATPLKLVGKQALEIETDQWLNSKSLTLSALRGKVVVIDFWAIWCGPCREELPNVEKLAKRFQGKPLVVIGLHDSTTWPAELSKFAKKNGLTYPLAIDKTRGGGSFGRSADKYGVRGIPTLFVIDQNGKIVASDVTPDEASKIVAKLLK